MGDVYSKVHVELFCHGNLTAAEAMETAAIARRTLLVGATPLPASSRPQERVLRLGGDKGETALVAVVEQVTNANEENSAVESYFQVGRFALPAPTRPHQNSLALWDAYRRSTDCWVPGTFDSLRWRRSTSARLWTCWSRWRTSRATTNCAPRSS